MNKLMRCDEDYGVNNDNASKLITDVWTADVCRSRFPYLFKWAKEVMGMPDEWPLKLTCATAAVIDAVWSGNGSGFNPSITCTSRNRVLLPNGYAMINYHLPVSYGGLIGYGNGWSGPLGNNVSYLRCDHDRWAGDRADRTVVRSVNWNTNNYLEGALVDGFRVDGGAPGWKDPSYHQSGIELRSIGEGVNIGTRDGIYVHDCNDHGIDIYGSGPGNIGTISSFDNNGAGMMHRSGGSLGLLSMVMLSMDNNGWGYYNDNAGGIVMQAMKCENGMSLSRNKPLKQMPAIYAKGLIGIELGMLRYSLGSNTPIPALIILEANAGQGSMLDVRKLMIHQGGGSSVDKLVLCSSSGKAYGVKDTTKPWRYYALHWECAGGVAYVNTGTSEGVEITPWGGHDRLGMISTMAEANYAAGLPAWTPTGGTTPPVVVPPVVVPPVVVPLVELPTKLLYELRGPVQVGSTTYMPIDVPHVTRVRLSILPRNIRWGRILGTGANMPSLMVQPNGLLYYGNQVVTTEPLVEGVKSELDILLPEAIHATTLWQTSAGQGGALQGIYDYIELY